jgi:hypothetical protein
MKGGKAIMNKEDLIPDEDEEDNVKVVVTEEDEELTANLETEFDKAARKILSGDYGEREFYEY